MFLLSRDGNLTFHSTGRLTAPVNSNYKGIPVCQAKRVLDESIIDSSRHIDGVLQLRRLTAKEPRCGLHNYNRPLMQRSMLRALMKDARGGLHSLAAVAITGAALN
jgi:hypothetical protein